MIKKEELKKIKKDLENLIRKLSTTLTKNVYKEKEQTQQQAEIKRKQEARNIRSILKDKITSYETLMRAEEIIKEIDKQKCSYKGKGCPSENNCEECEND